METNPDMLNKVLAGASGSAIAAWIAKATGINLFMMFMGGFSAAWFLGPFVATNFSLQAQESPVGFVIGFIAILVMRKAFAAVEAVSGESVGKAFLDWFKKLLGV